MKRAHTQREREGGERGEAAKHRETERGRQTGRQADRDRQREKERETERDRDRDREAYLALEPLVCRTVVHGNHRACRQLVEGSDTSGLRRFLRAESSRDAQRVRETARQQGSERVKQRDRGIGCTEIGRLHT